MSTTRSREDELSPQIADIQREAQQLARQRREERDQGIMRDREERRTYRNGPHMLPKLSNSSIFKTEQAIRQEHRRPRPSAPPVSLLETLDLRGEDESAPARNSEVGHNQLIIDIQREVEQQAILRRVGRRSWYTPHMPMRLTDSSIIGTRQEERPWYPNTSHMPMRFPDSSIIGTQYEERPWYPNTSHIPIRSSDSSITGPSLDSDSSYSGVGDSNSSVNYPHAPPATPDGGIGHLQFPSWSNSKDDGLPSYDEAVVMTTKPLQPHPW